MNFSLENHREPAVDSLSLIERIMGLIQITDALLSESLGYSITFHSMLASMESTGFSFQVDMEIDPPQQLILGDRMSGRSLEAWFSESHEVLTRFIIDQFSLDELRKQEEKLLDKYRQCEDNLLFRPVDPLELEQIQQEYRELWKDQTHPLIFSMKKVPQGLEEFSK